MASVIIAGNASPNPPTRIIVGKQVPGVPARPVSAGPGGAAGQPLVRDK
jgi:hypothetical protein